MITTVFSVMITLPSKGGRFIGDHESNICFIFLDLMAQRKRLLDFGAFFWIYSLIAYGAGTLTGHYLLFLGVVLWGPCILHSTNSREKFFEIHESIH